MGALTLTGLIPTIYAAMNEVSRERVGFIRAVGRDSTAERAAQDEVVRSPVVGAMVAEDLVAAAASGDTPNQTIEYVDMTIDRIRSVPFGITGEETLALRNGGTLLDVNGQRIAQALRALTNEIEADLGALHTKASRAHGTATGTPFSVKEDLDDFAQALRIMEENGAPQSDLHMVLGSTSTARIRGKQSSLLKVNEAGSAELLRTGAIGMIENFAIHQSAGVRTGVTAGTITANLTVTGVEPVGETTINVTTDGSGACALVAGDIIGLAGDGHQYVVAEDVTIGNSTTGDIVIQEPGLKEATSATQVMTAVAATTRNMFFHRGALQLATRAPAMPDGGDSADEVRIVVDPNTGLAFEFCVYRQKRQVRYEVNLAWGVAAPQPRHLGLLIGA